MSGKTQVNNKYNTFIGGLIFKDGGFQDSDKHYLLIPVCIITIP
jgi:hypothetical protein